MGLHIGLLYVHSSVHTRVYIYSRPTVRSFTCVYMGSSTNALINWGIHSIKGLFRGTRVRWWPQVKTGGGGHQS